MNRVRVIVILMFGVLIGTVTFNEIFHKLENMDFEIKETEKNNTKQLNVHGNSVQYMKQKGNPTVLLSTNDHLRESTQRLQKFLRVANPPTNKNVDVNKKYSQAKQDDTVFKILQKENGVFIEMGAFDGQTYSNTLWLERRHKWTGILIEANPYNCAKIDALKRNAWRLCACISDKLDNVSFVSAEGVGGVENELTEMHLKNIKNYPKSNVPCFKMNLVLNAVGIHHIDYFSLDIEGGEMNFLNSIRSFLLSGEIIVDVWTIEYRVWPKNNVTITLKNLKKLRNFFTELGGYFEHSKLTERTNLSDQEALDIVFVRTRRWCINHASLPTGLHC